MGRGSCVPDFTITSNSCPRLQASGRIDYFDWTFAVLLLRVAGAGGHIRPTHASIDVRCRDSTWRILRHRPAAPVDHDRLVRDSRLRWSALGHRLRSVELPEFSRAILNALPVTHPAGGRCCRYHGEREYAVDDNCIDSPPMAAHSSRPTWIGIRRLMKRQPVLSPSTKRRLNA